MRHSEDHHEALAALARRRGLRGFSPIVEEALDAYLHDLSSEETDLLLSPEGSIDDDEECVAGLVVVDTDLLVDYLPGRGAGATLVRELVRGGRLRVTTITSFELRAGAVAAELRAQGRSIGVADCLQAGICLRHDLPLATRDRAHFERVEGLRLTDLDD